MYDQVNLHSIDMPRHSSSFSPLTPFFSSKPAMGWRHYGLLVLIIAIGTGLRFWNLDGKALWLDEVIGAIFSFGRNLEDVPLNQFFDFAALDAVFRLNPDATCADIAQSVATDSVHPPLYFCLAHRWLSVWSPVTGNWVWVLRSLPAVIGIACIPAIYALNRALISPLAGLTGAMLMAVSPFAVYLSQEARHYTLPMLISLLTLLALAQILKSMLGDRPIPWTWLGIWAVLSSAGLYVHYFYLLVVTAQAIALLSVVLWLAYVRPPARQHPTPPSSQSVKSESVESENHRSNPDPSNPESPDTEQPKTNASVHYRTGQIPTPIFSKRIYQHSARFGLALTVVAVSYLPWLPKLLSHFGRPETDWLKPYNPDWSDRIAPIYQTLSNLLLMVVAFPIERQPWTVVGLSAVGMVILGGWVLYQAATGLRQRWRSDVPSRPQLALLLVFVSGVLVEFFTITYVLDKDVTSVPRYAFVYYPGMAALIGIGLAQRFQQNFQPSHSIPRPPASFQNTSVKLPRSTPAVSRWQLLRQPLTIALVAGGLSSLLVVNGWVFQKGYYPRTVAQDITFEGDRPVMLVVSYQSLQEVGLGLSFALAMQNQHAPNIEENATPSTVRIAFIHRPRGFGHVWRSLSALPHDVPLPLNLWVVASPGMKTQNYPDTLKLRVPNRRQRTTCTIDPDQFYRIGFPYQLFRCPERQRQNPTSGES
jgi:uncharacterized membrane protein